MTRQRLSLKRNDQPRSRLSLTRRSGESLEIGDATVYLRVVEGRIKVTIDAPRSTRIRRSELEPYTVTPSKERP